MAMQVVCCVCQRCKAYNGWHRVLLASKTELSHGYCPECFHQAMVRFGLDPEINETVYEEKGYGSIGLREYGAVMLAAKGE